MSIVNSALIELDPATVQTLLTAGEAVLVDVREDDEYAEEHIAGSLLYPMSDFEVDKWPSVTGKKVIISCLGGVRSAAIGNKLISAGHGWVSHMKGGLNAWKDAGLPTITQD
ncbi:rhodanese-like domain-containing protein [Magnetospirillum sulfuroxidans]|uniref:Rhodanese-like domain-containing protein n=1 Tax=Magnetospirillum sulfuroxidans TaxID=611300 RepID=A0ABS5IH72_9PROT|nr:rhodanese-like domain-containing protein [Magnetospirillum sulfuroxidans]MBR9973103.1 rhodanese-like domain-containing protein [Magnetospirillum sulfuroxidans]